MKNSPRSFLRLHLVTFLAGFAALSASGNAAESIPALQTPGAFGQVAGKGVQTDAWEDASLRSEMLSRFSRLLPEKLTEADRGRWSSLLHTVTEAGEDMIEKAVSSLAPADELVFNGEDYEGGNLAFIDSLLGKSGRLIAFDRDLPAILVPLSPEAELALSEKRTAFQANAENRPLRDAAGKAHGAPSADALFADGVFLRPYAGRFDDLYFHLSQNGNGPSSIAFGALVDGLAQRRTYRPVNGVCQISRVPAASYDLSNILTEGGKAAVVRHLRARYERPIEPFHGFAFRVIPTIIGRARTLPAGARFSASTDEMLKALRAKQHYYPIQVPPVYRSADRFLGWAGSLFLPVATRPVLPPGAAESWYPLPQRSGRATAETATEGASSAQLFESNTAPDLPAGPDGKWEDPQLSSLLTVPETRTQPANPAQGKSAPEAPRPADPTDPRLRPVVGRLIAVVTPTAEEGVAYLAAIAASDGTLRQIERARGRARLQRQFVESAGGVGSSAPGVPVELQHAVTADLAALGEREQELEGRLQEALQQRATLRSELEARLVRERVKPLEELGKKSREPELKPEPASAKPMAAVNL